MQTKRRIVIATCIGVVLLAISVYAATSNFFVSGAVVSHSEIFNGPATMSVREFTIQPNETLPWHYHPGIVFVAVKSGTLTHENGCGGEETFTAGQAFEKFDHDIHRAKNLTSSPVVLIDTFVVPAGQPLTVNTPNNERLCGPPQNAGSCRNGGWTNFTFPRIFQNQGDCEQYILTGN